MLVYHLYYYLREKGRDMTQFYDKTLTPTENSKKQSDNTQKRHQNFDYKTDCGPT